MNLHWNTLKDTDDESEKFWLVAGVIFRRNLEFNLKFSLNHSETFFILFVLISQSFFFACTFRIQKLSPAWNCAISWRVCIASVLKISLLEFYFCFFLFVREENKLFSPSQMNVTKIIFDTWELFLLLHLTWFCFSLGINFSREIEKKKMWQKFHS
jgi:hypothetical protein